MQRKTGELIFFCGKMGAGKSTLASKIAHQRNAPLLSEDDWLESLYPNAIKSLDDYLKYAARIKTRIKPLVQSILCAGTDVVMDFPANTRQQRTWLQSIFAEVEAPHTLVYLDVRDVECLARIRNRSLEQPHRAATDTVEMFNQVTNYFVAPQPEEGLNVVSGWPDAR